MASQDHSASSQVNPVIALMRAHRSIRNFTPQAIPQGWVETILEAAQWASSTSFRQTYSVIAITDLERKRSLRQVCGGQRWIEECPVFLAFCADMNRLDDICKAREKRANLEHTETFLMAALDAGLFLQNAALAAESLGLGVVMIGGLRDNPREVIRLLQLPHGVFGVSGMCLGFAEKVPGQRPRLPLSEVLHWDHYQSAGRSERLAAYDGQIRAAGTYRRKDGLIEGWTDVMARTTSKPPPEEGRYQLRQILLEQGFELK
jgi:FMN reductase (NADPH)